MKKIMTDIKTHYYCYEACYTKEKAETILLVHGLGFNMTVWEDIVPMLREHFHVLRCDLPGHGTYHTTLEEPISWPVLTRYITQLLEQLSITTVHYVGHSGGGLLGLQLASEGSEILQSLTLLSTPVFIPKELGKAEMEDRLARAESNLIEDIAGPFIDSLCYPATSEKSQRVIQMYKETALPAYLEYFHLYGSTLLSYHPEQFQSLKIRTMMLVGEYDVLYPPKLQMLNINYFDHARFFVLPNCSNLMMLDQPERVATYITQFIRTIDILPRRTYNYTDRLTREIQAIIDSGIQQSESKHVIELHIVQPFQVWIDGKSIMGK